MNYVPYQKCPLCDGKGFVWNTGVSSSVSSMCDACHGAKIIPMYVIQESTGQDPYQDLNIDPIIFKTDEQ